MLPKPPPREPSLGFVYVPPFRIQGLSVAGESTCVMAPELDICFDMGSCPRAVLPSRFAAISHGHMDHIGSLAYYCSQRRFQGMGDGTIVCDLRIAAEIQRMMEGYVDLERQRTPYQLIALEPEQAHEIKNNILLRGFHTEHTSPSMGYVVVEMRSKLREEYLGLPQEKLRELRARGVEITRTLEIPLLAYLGDTSPGGHLLRDDVRKAQIVVCECTFFEPDHKGRAKIGKHMHVDDIVEWLRVLECEALIITHVSRRTHLTYAREHLRKSLNDQQMRRVRLLMDHRTNRADYEALESAAGPDQRAEQ
jgi:ribonuclease Z